MCPYKDGDLDRYNSLHCTSKLVFVSEFAQM